MSFPLDGSSPKATFIAEGSEDIQRLVAVLALGMCRALAEGMLQPDYGCHRLFSPALLARLEQIDAHPELRDAIALAMEFEDVADLVPGGLPSSSADVETKLRGALKDVNPGKLAGEKWLKANSE